MMDEDLEEKGDDQKKGGRKRRQKSRKLKKLSQELIDLMENAKHVGVVLKQKTATKKKEEEKEKILK